MSNTNLPEYYRGMSTREASKLFLKRNFWGGTGMKNLIILAGLGVGITSFVGYAQDSINSREAKVAEVGEKKNPVSEKYDAALKSMRDSINQSDANADLYKKSVDDLKKQNEALAKQNEKMMDEMRKTKMELGDMLDALLKERRNQLLLKQPVVAPQPVQKPTIVLAPANTNTPSTKYLAFDKLFKDYMKLSLGAEIENLFYGKDLKIWNIGGNDASIVSKQVYSSISHDGYIDSDEEITTFAGYINKLFPTNEADYSGAFGDYMVDVFRKDGTLDKIVSGKTNKAVAEKTLRAAANEYASTLNGVNMDKVATVLKYLQKDGYVVSPDKTTLSGFSQQVDSRINDIVSSDGGKKNE